jgi:restriction system protein
MAIPPFWVFMRPVLEVLQDGLVRRRRDVSEAVVAAMDLSPEDLSERLKGGGSRADSRAHWAIEYLAQAGAIERPKRGEMRISEIGKQLLADHPDVITEADLQHLAGFQDWVARSRESARNRRRSPEGVGDQTLRTEDGETPLERLVESIEVLNSGTADELVERLRLQPPDFLERAVLKLMHAMGYGGSEEDGEHLGQSHDGGLDGVIRQDSLGIEQVYLQVKRYARDNTVGAPAIREFVGALTGVGASGGIFITTSTFSSDAKKYVERLNPRVILIDGRELGRLMVEYGVGVTVAQTLKVSEVDENFFSEE